MEGKIYSPVGNLAERAKTAELPGQHGEDVFMLG